MMMLKFLTLAFGCALSLLLCSCSTFEPTQSVNEALAHTERDIEYHNRAYMEKKPVGSSMVVSDIKKINEPLYFKFEFNQGNTGENNANALRGDVWNAFRREFENAISGSKRFPVGQIGYGLADNKVRKDTHNGTANVDEFDPSELKQISNLIHITPMLSNSSVSKGNQRTTTYTFKLVCNPLSAKNNAPLDEFQQFSVQFSADVKTLTDKFGRIKSGLRFDDFRGGNKSSRLYEDFQLRQARAAIVQFFVHMYKIFPVGGVVTNFDEDGRVNIKANRANGLQRNMEFVVFGVKKGDPDAIPVPLYNATAVMVSQTKNSTLQIWRKSEKKTAVKIIKLIESDIDAARDEYEFFAAADGFAEWPDFIQRSTPVLEK